ncbi:MAG TPA: CHAD domain-containing protein, partial [Pirellulales bacterium]
MVRKTKWIESSAVEDRFDVVARRALEGRLDFVWHFLTRAAAADHQPEDVHQLRVATRRAMAALEIFQTLLPPRRTRKMKKQLKRIRRAAGGARDLDVLAARLKKDQNCHDVDRGAKLQQFVSRLRSRAQPAIKTLHVDLSANDRFVCRAQSLIARLRFRPADGSTESDTFAEAAWQGVRPSVDRFFTAAA